MSCSIPLAVKLILVMRVVTTSFGFSDVVNSCVFLRVESGSPTVVVSVLPHTYLLNSYCSYLYKAIRLATKDLSTIRIYTSVLQLIAG